MTALPTLNAIDTRRFGVPIARVNLDDADGAHADSVSSALDWCRQYDIIMLVARCPVAAIGTVHALETSGARLMDTLIYFRRGLDGVPYTTDGVRFAGADDAPAVGRAAASAFRGYHGHYHADPRLDPALCDAGYVEWAVNSTQPPTDSAAMLIADVEDGAVGGFATVRLNTPDEGEGVLFAVDPAYQGRGLYRALLERSIGWCRERGARTMVYSTQITNVAAQTMMARLGFGFDHAFYTFHLWFDERTPA
jgi:GNAT superfamily N-acetyltransferase